MQPGQKCQCQLARSYLDLGIERHTPCTHAVGKDAVRAIFENGQHLCGLRGCACGLEQRKAVRHTRVVAGNLDIVCCGGDVQGRDVYARHDFERIAQAVKRGAEIRMAALKRGSLTHTVEPFKSTFAPTSSIVVLAP